MTTSVELTQEEIADLQAMTNQPDAASAIRAAMIEFLQYARRQHLKSLSGRVEMQENWAELEASEMKPFDGNPTCSH